MAKKVAKKCEVEKIVDAVAGLNVSDVVSQIGELQVSVQKTLADLSGTITQKLVERDEIAKAIDAKKQQLQEVYAIEQEALSLENMKAMREAEQSQWDQQRQQQRIAWQDETSARTKNWTREEEEHAYAVKIRNVRAEEEHKASVDKHMREEAIRQDILQRGWKDRENAIAAQEADIKALRDQAAGFESRVKLEVDKQVAIVSNTIKRNHDQELALLRKDTEANDKLHKSELASLQNTIGSMAEQIDALKEQLEVARKDAKEVTQKALEATSQKEAFSALQRVVDTQTTTGKSK
jgi:hypothetical protein